MDSDALEQTLLNLPKVGRLVKDRGYRQIWRFEHAGRAYYLKFYPREGFWWKRFFRGNPAMREFTRLQALQKAAVPSPRARSVLMGFKIDGRVGDAVILDAIEPSIQLDHCLNDLELHGRAIPDHLELARQITDLVHRLGEAGLGHSDLHLGNFLLHQDKIHLLDGYAVRTNGLRTQDVLLLGYSVARYATRGDLMRGWNLLSHGAPLPRRNPLAPRQYRKFLERITQESHHFGNIEIEGWRGYFFKDAKFPRRWSRASQIRFTHEDWRRAGPELLRRIERDELTILKRSASGDVLSGAIEIAGHSLEIIVKRPRKKLWHRYVTALVRPGRAPRMWQKAWRLFIGNFAVEWPILLLEKRTLGYPTDAIIIFEKMQGDLLAEMDLDALDNHSRRSLFHRLGRTLRKIDEQQLSHTDAKAYNWIIQQDEATGPLPIMIDVDSIRDHAWGAGKGIIRLLRSMEEHPRYTPEDSLALCRGYTPAARMVRAGAGEEEAREDAKERS